MKNIFLLFAILMVAAFRLAAQTKLEPVSPPPSVQQVMKFFEIMHVREQTQSLLQAQQKQMKIMFTDIVQKKMPDATPAQRAKFEAFMDSTMDSLFRDYPIDDVLRDMVPVYQNHLSEADLNAVIAFYSSAVGQKLLRELPAMSAEGMRVSYSRLQPKIDEMMKNMDQQVQKMIQDDSDSTTKSAPDKQPQK